MGANPKQASGIVLFLIAFVLIASGIAVSSMLLIVAGLVALGLSFVVLKKIKPLEHHEGI